MKRSLAIVAFVLLLAASVSAQDKTFETLRNKFGGRENVFAFSASGFMARTVLWMAGENEFKDAIRHIRAVRFITIPKSAFREDKVTVPGLKKLILKDKFEEVASVRDHGDDVTFYLHPGKTEKLNRYFVLVDDNDEVVAIEIKGYIDTARLRSDNNLSYNSR